MLENLNKVAAKPQRVVVIGAGGFVGSTTVQNLTGKGINTLPITRNEVNLLQENAQAALSAFIQPGDALVIISAIAPTKTSAQLVQNLRMIEPVCEVITQHNDQLSQIIYISSDAVYADDVALANESSTVQPSSLHGMMHAARELMIKTAAGSVPCTILRPSLLYGLQDPHNGYGPNRFFRLAREHKDITLFGGGEEQRDHIYVEDVAELIAQTLLYRSTGTMNIATGESISFKDIADQVVAISKSSVNVIVTERKNPITHRHFDITACRRAFPQFSFTQIAAGLAKVQQQFLAQVPAQETEIA